MEASGASSNGSSLMRASRNDETVKVIVRCRPLSQQEIGQGHDRIVKMATDRGLIELRNPKGSNDEPTKDFTFDAIYDENSRQIDLYEETFRELVDSVLNGFNGTIFAYGQTGTGKSYTMEGSAEVAEERGVLPNSFEHIFAHIAASRNQQYLVRASYLEIYQEELRDLLVEDAKQKLELKERPDTGIYVPNLKSTVCKSIVEIRRLMAEGNKNRMTAFTNMNERSSRSHAIFIITIECSEMGADGQNHIRVGRLNLVDLAGSERQAKTGATGDRLKEATKINLSLSALGNVISALVDGRSSHIPYRDSKLTRLLQDSLGGNSKTVMVACIGPASYNFEETLSTLRYANRAKNIKNRPKINEDPKDALLREFQEEINRLKAMLETKKKGGGRPMTSSGRASSAASSGTGDDDWDGAQRRMEREREAIENDANLIESEKSRLLSSLQSRVDALDQEKRAQQVVAERLKKIQESMLGGDEEALLGRTRAQNEELEQRRKMIAEQKKREREMQEQLEQREESMNEIHSTVTNLKQELEGRQRRLKKMYIKLQKARMGLEDARISSSSERQETENSVTELTKELKLKLLIVENFIPLEVRERVESSVSWDDDNQLWTRPSTSTAGDDSGVGSTEEVRYESVVPEEVYEARPIATPGARRPMSRVERARIEHARDRLTRRGARPPFFDPPPHVEASMPEEFARFCGENVLIFNTVERAPRRVKDINEAISQAKSSSIDRPMSSSTVTLDLGGSSLMTSSSNRPPSRSHLRTPSAGRSRSKNCSARNALPSAPVPSDRSTVGGPIKVSPLGLGPARPTPASVVVYPTARGLVGTNKNRHY
ncbi:klp-11 [Pristionchus pacificus]|nr:klp-11 [Pristionchus pacificus]